MAYDRPCHQFRPRPLPAEPFADSIGVNTERPEPVSIEFDRTAAEYIREREWHPSQRIEDSPEGLMLLRLNVCIDRPLVRWILGFGPSARVVAPEGLAQTVCEHLDAARERYARPPRLVMARMGVEDVVQPFLPWRKIS